MGTATATATMEPQTIFDLEGDVPGWVIDSEWLVPIPTPEDAEDQKIPRHHLSEMFKGMSDKEWEVFDIGLERYPVPQMLNIIMYEGQILDGWHRYWSACNYGKVGMLSFFEYRGPDPLTLVIMCNFSRRHIKASVRAGIMALAVEMQGRGKGKKNMQGSVLGDTQKARAAAIHVSTRQYQRAERTIGGGLGEWLTNGDITAEDGEDIVRQGLAHLVLSGEKPIEEVKKIVRDERKEKKDRRRFSLVGSTPQQDPNLVVVQASAAAPTTSSPSGAEAQPPAPEYEQYVPRTVDAQPPAPESERQAHVAEAQTAAPESERQPHVADAQTPVQGNEWQEPRTIDALRQQLEIVMEPMRVPHSVWQLVDKLEQELDAVNAQCRELQLRIDNMMVESQDQREYDETVARS